MHTEHTVLYQFNSYREHSSPVWYVWAVHAAFKKETMAWNGMDGRGRNGLIDLMVERRSGGPDGGFGCGCLGCGGGWVR